jgi:ubiquinone/menaquinone biosynthesis C-methylase UbiE
MPKTSLPPYIKDLYSWLYLNPKLYNFLDNAFILNILTLGHHHILTEEVKKEISPHFHILQTGLTLGSQIEKTYLSLGMLGSYTIVDIIPELLENCREKHLDQKINLIHADVSKTIKGEYDVIICYMLLHELPPFTRKDVLNNIIKALKPGGKAIFIDYHMPYSYNPLKYIIRAVNRLYQPFAESLWKNGIKDLTPNAELCSWSQQTYFGGIYQKVIATKYNR